MTRRIEDVYAATGTERCRFDSNAIVITNCRIDDPIEFRPCSINSGKINILGDCAVNQRKSDVSH